MRDRLFIRIEADFPDKISWLRVSDAAEQHWTLSRGGLVDAVREAAGCQVIVLVPGGEVLLTRATVPSRQRKHIINAVPYALEDQLVSDIDELHFALGPRDEQGVVPVAVVAKKIMSAWLLGLREAGLEPDVMLADVMALPLTEDGWTLLHDGDAVLLRQNIYTGAMIDTQAFNVWCDLALGEVAAEQGEGRPQKIRLYDCQHDSEARLSLDVAAINTLVDGDSREDMRVMLDVVAQKEAPLYFLAQHFSMGRCINLIQGDYSRREQLGRIFRPWGVAASLLLVVVLLGVGKTVADYVSLSQASDRLQVEIKQIYLDTFPKARKVPDAEKQMKDKLAALKTGGDDRQGFLALLALIGRPLQVSTSAELRHISYQDSRLSLSLRIKSLQLLEQLKQGLLSNKGLNVDIQSAASRDEYVDVRLQIWLQGA